MNASVFIVNFVVITEAHVSKKLETCVKRKFMQRETVFVTGVTGSMGGAFMRIYAADRQKYPYKLKVLARDTAKSRRILRPYRNDPDIEIIYGDLRDSEVVARGVDGAGYVIHVGGMVSPSADYYPEETMDVNVNAMRNIVEAVKRQPDPDRVHVVYIGSVSQLGMRHVPHHWGRSGDPVWGAEFDWYAQSKIEAERVLAESGLKHWASLRQTGILAPVILKKGSDPITFHVPLRGVLEWVTEEDSGRLVANIPVAGLPEKFWKNFYNIGGGESYRLTNYEFMCKLLGALHCPIPEKAFDARWFATSNFHGQWYEDSDLLDDYLHFRSGESADEYFKSLAESLPWFYSLASVVPAGVIRAAMRFVAGRKPFGPFYWKKINDERRINAYFGGMENWKSLRKWEDIPREELENFTQPPVRLDHGYDESKDESLLDIADMRGAAEFRGGKCLSGSMTPGDLDTPLEWECHAGHVFRATPRIVLKGGHWCPDCMGHRWEYEEEAHHNPFFAQIWK